MATRTLNTKITLEGEREYKQAISEINSGIGVLNSELRKNAEQFRDNAGSVEALTAKGDILERKLLSQKDKVAELQKALENAKKEYGESSTKTMEWEKKLNDAEAAVYKTENAIKDNNAALEQARQQTDKNTISVSDLAEKLGINLPEGAKKALDGIGEFNVGSVAAFSAVAAAIVIVIDAMKELTQITQEAAGYVDDLNTMAVKSGIDTYTLQVLNYMEDLADVDVSSVVSSMGKLEQSMAKAADGTVKQQEAFDLLGVSILNTDGTMRDANEVFWESIDALGQVQNATERDQIAMDVFGRSAKELNTLIAVGSEGFNGYAKEAESVGYILDSKANKALNSYNDSLDRANKQMEAIRNQMAAQMAPGLEELTTAWANLKKNGLDLIINSGIIEGLSNICVALGEVIKFVGDMIGVLNDLMHPIETIQKLFGYQNKTLQDNAKATQTATSANEAFKASVSSDALVLNNTANAANNAANALRQYAAAAGYAQISDARLAELGSYSESNAEHGAGFLGDYAGYTRDEFKSLLAQNGITSASQISSVLGEDAYRYYLSSAYYNAAGDYNFVGGRTIVGENGPEMVTLPRGSQIATAQETRNGSGDTYNITIDARNIRELNDIIRIVKYSRVTERMRG